MKPTSLSGADYTAYRRALMGLDGPTMVRTDFHVMTLDHKFISTISPLALDGQVDMDATAETVWALNATFLDPEHILGFDGHGPTDGMGRLNCYACQSCQQTKSHQTPSHPALSQLPIRFETSESSINR